MNHRATSSDEQVDVSEYDVPSIGKRRLAIDSPLLHRKQLRHFVFFNVMPIVLTAVAIVFSRFYPIHWIDVALFFGFWLATGLGISAGYHRLLCHQSYRASGPLRILLIILGSMAAVGPAVSWVAMHRRHHHIADQNGDVHSPNLHGSGFMGKTKGFIHAHFTWMIRHEYPNLLHYVPDILADPMAVKVSRKYLYWVGLGLVLPAVIGGLVSGTILGAVSGFLWGGAVRMFVVGQSISALNSILHLVGEKRFRGMGKLDSSRNNWLMGLLIWGEGWHNNHHAFPYSASFALAWYKIDMSFWFIKTCEALGFAWDVKTPTRERLHFRAVNEAN